MNYYFSKWFPFIRDVLHRLHSVFTEGMPEFFQSRMATSLSHPLLTHSGIGRYWLWRGWLGSSFAFSHSARLALFLLIFFVGWDIFEVSFWLSYTTLNTLKTIQFFTYYTHLHTQCAQPTKKGVIIFNHIFHFIFSKILII